MNSVPDQIWIDAEYWEWRGWNAALLKAEGGNYNYLRATPARIHADELLEVLREVHRDLADMRFIVLTQGEDHTSFDGSYVDPRIARVVDICAYFLDRIEQN